MTKEILTRHYAIHQACHWAVVGMLVPVLILIFQFHGLTLKEVGIVMAVWVGATAVLEIPLGSLADKYGRKLTYLLSLLLNLVGAISLYFAANIQTFCLTAIILGAARAVYSGTLDAWFYDYFQASSGTKTFHSASAIVNLMTTLGLAIGAYLGGLLPNIGIAVLHSANSPYDLNIVATLIGNIGLIILTALLIKDPSKTKHSHPDTTIEANQIVSAAIHNALKNTQLRRLLQTACIYGMVLISLENFWQPFLAALLESNGEGADTRLFGGIAAGYLAVAALSSLAAVSILRLLKGSHLRLLMASRALSGSLLIILSQTASISTFATYYLLFFFWFTIGSSSEKVLLNTSTASQHRSTMISIHSFVVTGGAVLSSLLLSYIAERWGVSSAWLLCGVILTATSTLFREHRTTTNEIKTVAD
ncbi:MFS transporter [Vibrio sp. CB1-14]|uniref:MFS transporter n=1 Tax=Vibrio chaetopteri TaxID=3016528 RepID=A0AAU8BTI7_9VIBR